MDECSLCSGSGIYPMAGSWICFKCGGGGGDAPLQPAYGYTKNVTPPRGSHRQEDAFPESCCEGTPPETDNG